MRPQREPPSPEPADGDMVNLGEPLAESAPIARRLAPRLCRPVGPGTANCAPYHGLVQFLRLLGLVSSPVRHGRFYRAAMRDAPSRAKRRVLIAGAADYGMLAMVLDACAAPGVALDVTVVDRCPTPLALCHWYARREKVRIVTVVADIAEFEVEDAFDLICTDSLLTLLKPEDRALTLARWRALLRPGGRVVTVARISAPGNAARIDRVQRIAGFSDLVRERATGMADRLDVDPAVLADEALSYGSSVTVSPIGSVAELEHGLASAGLELDVLDVGDLPGSVPADRAGPGAHQPATYARVVARAG